MFAYCRNNPACRKDVTGTEDTVAYNDGELLSNDDLDDRAKSGGKGSGTRIYRYGGTNKGNLVPKEKDLNPQHQSGLSFSTEYRPGAATTTIEAVNNTGVIYAVKDGATHVSVYPVGATIWDWYCAGVDSVWTQTLREIVHKAK